MKTEFKKNPSIVDEEAITSVSGGRAEASHPIGRQQVCPYCRQLYVPGDGHNCQSMERPVTIDPEKQWNICKRCGKRIPKGYSCSCKA